MIEKNLTIQSLIDHDMHEYERFSMMLSKTVHDINNPLAVFIGQISIMELMQKRNQLTPDKIDLIIEKFKSSSNTLKERLDQLRAFYKIPINSDQFDQVHQIFNSVLYYFENEIYNQNIQIDSSCPENIKTKLKLNELFLILKHLIQNSIEAISTTKPSSPKITLNCVQNGDNLVIEVSDNGPGLIGPFEIALELGYTTKSKKHTGSGLALINHILGQYDSQLNYQHSELTQFSFKIPNE